MEGNGEPTGGLGGGLIDSRTSVRDIRMIERAIRNDWPMSSDVRKVAVNQLAFAVAGRLKDGEGNPVKLDGRVMVAAARALIAADAVNVKREAMDQADEHARAGLKHPGVGVHVNVGVQVGTAVTQAVGQEPEYLDWIRERALAEAGNPDVVGANGHGGSLSDAAAHPGNGQGSNGHTEGNGRH